MKKFNWDEFKNTGNKIAVHCKTDEEAKDFCKQMHGQGMKWCTGDSYLENTNYNVHNEGTCYYGIGEYSSRDFAEKYNYKILEWSDYMQKEFTKKYLKSGMVVEYGDESLGRRVVIGDFLVGKDGYARLENYEHNLINRERIDGMDIVKVYKIKQGYPFGRIMEDHNLELIWERKEPKKMTIEEMRQKLEELTGEEIEVTA